MKRIPGFIVNLLFDSPSKAIDLDSLKVVSSLTLLNYKRVELTSWKTLGFCARDTHSFRVAVPRVLGRESLGKKIRTHQMRPYANNPATPIAWILPEAEISGSTFSQALSHRPCSDLRPRAETKFRENIPHVIFYRPLAQHQFVGDLAVRLALCD
jgi:hypothetical protein